jgi:GNAT superfamily N-acetyltransferase
MVTVRFADETDIDSIASVHLRAWHDAYRDVLTAERLNEGTPEFFRNRWRTTLDEHDPPARSVVVAEVDANIAGMVRIWPHDAIGRRAVLSYCHVLSGLQGQGIGSLLVKEAVRVGRERYDEMSLGVVAVHDQARNYWFKKGWRETGHIDERRGDGWVFDEVEYLRSLRSDIDV